MKRYEVDFPLKHPRYVIENVAYKEKRLPHHGLGSSMDQDRTFVRRTVPQPEIR